MNDHDVEIAIEEILMDGPFGARSEAIREALVAHLARLVAERGLPFGSLEIPRAVIDVSPELGADAIAAKVAEALYERLAGEHR